MDYSDDAKKPLSSKRDFQDLSDTQQKRVLRQVLDDMRTQDGHTTLPQHRIYGAVEYVFAVYRKTIQEESEVDMLEIERNAILRALNMSDEDLEEAEWSHMRETQSVEDVEELFVVLQDIMLDKI